MNGPMTRLWEVTLPASVISVAATPTLSLVVAGCVDRRGYAFDHRGERLWAHETDHEIWAAACTKDGNFVAFGTAEKKPAQGKIYILNRAGDTVGTFSIGMPVWSLDFDSTGTRLVAGTWGGSCHLFKLDGRQWKPVPPIQLAGAGVYGARWRGPSHIVAACYGVGLTVFSESGEIISTYPSEMLGYNVAVDGAGTVIAGGRSGTVVKVSDDVVTEIQLPSVSSALYAVATTSDGCVIFTGGSDGYLRAVDRIGTLLWEADLVGEVWSLASSPTGRFVVAGCGDGRVVVSEGTSTIEAMAELSAHLATLEADNAIGDTVAANRAMLDLVGRQGLFGFGLRFLASRHASGTLPKAEYGELLEYLGECCPQDHPDSPDICFERAHQRRERVQHWEAALMYLRATRSRTLRLRAFSEAATEFYKANHHAAALACFRRAREALLTSDDLKIIYTLARSFEDRGQKRVARDHLDMIMVQDPDYRDAASRLVGVRGSIGFDHGRADYTGITVNLLGPDGPTPDIDPRLKHILEARSRELSDKPDERASYDAVIEQLFDIGVLTARIGVDNVGYDTNSYVKYDFLLPEDDVKKRLEAINVISLMKKVGSVKKSLDIGTATGRYPGILKSMGIDAYGVDVEPAAIEYANSKFGVGEGPILSVGDARALPFSGATFDFVTCMMGTFFHIQLDEQLTALTEMLRVCRPGGLVAISTWDVECPHLTFLSMYSVNEQELILKNSRRADQMEALFREAGFVDVGIVKLALVPDTISYDLGIENLDVDGLKRLLEIDVAARASAPSKHGQMFIAYGQPPIA